MTVQIGELRARLTAEAQQMKQEIRTVKKDISDLGEEGKKAGRNFSTMNAALTQIGLNTEQLKKVEAQLSKINPSRVEQGLAEIVQELRRMGVESKQVEKVSKELKNVETGSVRAKQGVDGLGAGLASLGAGFAAERMVSMIQAFTDEATALSRSYRGLSEVSKSLNQDVGQTIGLADELADRWGLNKAALADTVKTYLTAGLTLDQTRTIITATADAAVYNREAHLEWDEAIRQVAQGIKMGNSELTDAAGITTNLSVMQERYAKSIGTTADKLTEGQKIQAAYNGILAEAAMFAGNADSAMTGYTGTQATYAQTLKTARVELGESFLPALERMMEVVTPVIKDLAAWVDQNEQIVVGLAAAAIAVTAMIAVVGGLTAAFFALNAVMGPVGWAILAIGAVTTGVVAYNIAASSAADSSLQFAESIEELNQKLDESPLKRTSDEVKGLQSDIDELNRLLVRRNELEKQYFNAATDSDATNLSVEITEIDAALRKMDFQNIQQATEALKRMKQHLEEAIPAVVALKRAEMAELATKEDQIKKTEELRRKYSELSSSEKLSEDQKKELAGVVQQLKKEYPDLIAKLDEEGRYHITNREAIFELIDAERGALRIKTELRKQELEDLKKSTEVKLKQAELEVSALEEVTKAQMRKDAPMLKEQFDESQIPDYVTGDMRKAMILQGKKLNEEANRRLLERTDGLNAIRSSLNEIKKMQQNLETGNLDDYRPKGPPSGGGGDPPDPKDDPQRKAFEEEIALIRYKAEMYDWSAQQQIEALEKVKQGHKAYLARAVEDERMVNLQIKQLHDAISEDELKQAEATRKAGFDLSLWWIEREKHFKRLSLEEEYAAWERVQNRYEEGSKERDRAEREMFRVREEMHKRELDRAEELEKQRKAAVNEVEDLLDKQKQAVENARRAELKAIKESREAFVDAQEEKIRAIDRLMDAEADANADSDFAAKLAEKRARAELLASAVGPEGKREQEQLLKEIADMETDHQRELRRRQLEAEKLALEDEKRTKEEAFDDQQDAVEQQYDDLIRAFEDYSGDVEGIEKSIQAFRISSTGTANAKILSDLDVFVESYRQKMATVTSISGDIEKQRDWAEYTANTTEWYSTNDPARKGELHRRNTELRTKYGVPQDDYDNLQHFSEGGVVAGIRDRAVPIVAHAGEIVLNAYQQNALFRMLDSATPSIAAQSTTNNSQQIVNHFDLSIDEVHVEDDADIESLYDERESLVKRIQARTGEKSL
ncbi:hypothetical protein [Paenibacillus koleovorans]|uniref:hypothetical protein n=1 Tax=Paenibacillus koleovorans TaxID=121608 RepID=UPI000FD9E54B|nr:hypothetical protein [Paenibacillus koleovorans]